MDYILNIHRFIRFIDSVWYRFVKIVESMKKRRKATDCQLIEASKTSPGYFKYLVTIEEKDGTINKIPCYGYDMQDAIRRLISNERAAKVVKVVNKWDWALPILWFVVMGTPLIISNMLDKPLIGQVGVIAIFTGMIGLALHISRLNKGR